VVGVEVLIIQLVNYSYLCGRCGTLERKNKHRHFSATRLSRKEASTLQDGDLEKIPKVSNIFVPLEMFADSVTAFRKVLAAKDLLHADPFVPALFLLSLIQRWCIACLSKDPQLFELHICRLMAPAYTDDYAEVACYIFGVEPNTAALEIIKNFVLRHTYE